MDAQTIIAIICSIGGLILGILGWSYNRKKEYNQEGENKATIKDLTSEIENLHKRDDKAEADYKERIYLLEKKFDKKIEEIQTDIKSIHKSNNKINVDIGKINTNIDNILKKLEKI